MSEETQNKETNILIALGSTSDLGLLAQIRGKREEYGQQGVNLVLSVASAHRTPYKVKQHAEQRDWDAVIAGAGLTNALLSRLMEYVDPVRTVMVGLPISDKATDGLSSYLSSTEMPPGYPAAAVMPDRLDSALELAVRLTTRKFDKLVLQFSSHPDQDDIYNRALETLKKLEAPFDRRSDANSYNCPYSNTELLLTPTRKDLPEFASHPKNPAIIYSPLDFETVEGILEYPERHKWEEAPIGFIGINAGSNLALYAAKVIARHDADLAARVKAHIEKGKAKYEPFGAPIKLDSSEAIDRAVALGGKK